MNTISFGISLFEQEMESAKEKDKYTANLGDEEVQDNEYDGTLVELK